MRKSYPILAFLILLSAGCKTMPVLPEAPLAEERIFLYMDALPQGEDRLKFSLSAIYAVREDQRQFPLSLIRREITATAMDRQHLLAAAPLPPGRYVGINFLVESAALKGEEGYSRLMPPDGPLHINFPFEIGNKKNIMLSLSFKPSDSVKEGFRFRPSWHLYFPHRPLLPLTAFVSNYGDNTLTIFDKRSGQVSGVIMAGIGPAGIAVDSARKLAYVALAGEDAVAVIDLMAGDVVNKITLQGGDGPKELALSPDGRTLLSANSGSNTVSVIDPLFLNERTRITVGGSPVHVVVDRAGQRAYAFNTFSNSISVLDLPGRAVVATVSTEPAPWRGEFNRKGDKLYIAHEWSPYLTVLDTASLSLAERLYVGPGVSYLKFDTNREILYVSKKNSSVVEAYDPLSLLPVDHIVAGGNVSHIAIDRDSGNFLFALPENKTVRAVNPASKETIFEIDAGTEPYGVAFIGER